MSPPEKPISYYALSILYDRKRKVGERVACLCNSFGLRVQLSAVSRKPSGDSLMLAVSAIIGANPPSLTPLFPLSVLK